VILSDLSDHFITYICPQLGTPKAKVSETIVSRDFSMQNLNKFRLDLGVASWNNVLESDEADSAYDCFWSTYKNLYKTNFPLKRKRFNKNFNPLNKFMTQGLITSRRTKNKLHATAVSVPTDANINRYKAYETIYQRLVRAAKKLFITNQLNENASNPKKTWQILHEILGKKGKTDSVSQINVDGVTFSEDLQVANQFNSFFTNAGKKYLIPSRQSQKNLRTLLIMGAKSPPCD
jgi:hypothetical protein